jgi:hypothetical protein
MEEHKKLMEDFAKLQTTVAQDVRNLNIAWIILCSKRPALFFVFLWAFAEEKEARCLVRTAMRAKGSVMVERDCSFLGRDCNVLSQCLE